MTGAAIAERPKAVDMGIDVDYAQLNPAIHTAIDRIAFNTGGGTMRIDGISEEGLTLMREVLRVAENAQLPKYYHDPARGYVQGGSTSPIQARHAEFVVGKVWQNEGLGVTSAYISIPPYGQETAEPGPIEADAPSRPPKKLLAALGTAAVIEWGAGVYGFAADKPAFLYASMAAMAGGAVGIVRLVSKY